MPAAISDGTRIEITFRNDTGGTEKVVVRGGNEYGKEILDAPTKGWSFQGSQLLE